MPPTRSIRFRFSSVFILVLALVVVLGLFTLWRLTDYHVFTEDIRDRYLRNTQYLGDLNNFTSDFRAAEGTALLAVTRAQSAANRADVEELDRRITLAQHSFEHVRNDPTCTELYADFAAKWLNYRRIADESFALASSGRSTEAVALYMTESHTAYDAASDALGILTERNRDQAQAASLRADMAYQQARWLTMVAVVLAAVVVLGGLVHIRRAILVPVLDLARRMRRLAENEMDIDIEGLDRSDEIGEMARSVEVFRNNAVDLAVSQRALAEQASLLSEKLVHERHLAELQRNFVSMASHEFRTPLTVIDGQAQRIATAKAAFTPDEIAQRARKIRAAVMRMTTVIDSLINASRLIDGDAKLYFHPVDCDLGMLLREVCQLHREVAPRAQIFEQMPKGPLRVRGDHKLLFQAFSNLVSNAVKYSSGSAIVRVEVRRCGDVMEIAVQDRGVGIPAQDRAHLFERYYRGSNVSGIVGTGIGLYLVKMVVDLHGGTIEVTSEEGHGSRFVIRLPATPDAGDSAAAEPTGASPEVAKNAHRV